MAGPEAVPPLLGFPVDGRVHVVDTATGRVLQNVEPGREERLAVIGGRLLRITARSQDGSCYYGISGRDSATGQEAWQQSGLNLRTADSAGCVQREDPYGARNVLLGVSPDGREAVLDAYDGRLLLVTANGERVLAVDDRYALVRTADGGAVSARELGAERTRWKRPAGKKADAALTPYAAIVADEKPNRLVALDPRTGRELAVLRTSANALAVGPAGMVIGEGREIGYVRFGATAGGTPGEADGADPGPAGSGAVPQPQDSCGPKNELCAPLTPVSDRAPRGGTDQTLCPRLCRHERAAASESSAQCDGASRRHEAKRSVVVSGADFAYAPLLPTGPDQTDYRLVTDEGVDVVNGPGGRRFLTVEPAALTALTAEAMHDIAHFLRPAHLAQLRSIIDDPAASPNDRFVALDLLRNANIAAGGVLPMCQDTGTAIVMGKRGRHVLTDGTDAEAISRGVWQAYTRLNLRYSQLAPLTMWEERNTGSNLPAQVELYADDRTATRTRTSSSSWPRAAARPTSRTSTRRRRRC